MEAWFTMEGVWLTTALVVTVVPEVRMGGARGRAPTAFVVLTGMAPGVAPAMLVRTGAVVGTGPVRTGAVAGPSPCFLACVVIIVCSCLIKLWIFMDGPTFIPIKLTNCSLVRERNSDPPIFYKRND